MKRSEMMLQYFLNQINICESEIDYMRNRRYLAFDEFDLFNMILSLKEKEVLERVMRDYIIINKLDIKKNKTSPIRE